MRKIGKVLAYDEKTGKIVDDKLKTYIFTSEDILGDVKVNDVVLFSPEVYRTIEVTENVAKFVEKVNEKKDDNLID